MAACIALSTAVAKDPAAHRTASSKVFGLFHRGLGTRAQMTGLALGGERLERRGLLQ